LFTPVIPAREVLTWCSTELEPDAFNVELPLPDFEATPVGGTL
jgi:hypothetical protein